MRNHATENDRQDRLTRPCRKLPARRPRRAGPALLALGLLAAAHAPAPGRAEAPPPPVVKEAFFTDDQARENIDSPAAWRSPDGEDLLFASSKEGHSVNVFDAANGAMIRRLGGLGAELGQFNRPNGLWVVGDYLLVVERDNRRVQAIHLPDMTAVAAFGAGEQKRPYGIWASPLSDGEAAVYVTDDYEVKGALTQAGEALGKRVNRFAFEAVGRSAEGEWEAAFGAVSGPGRLFVVESIHGDLERGRLLVAEELEDDELGRSVKVYDFQGRFAGETMGKGVFANQVEGIALYDKGQGQGYWFVADQGKQANYFHVFDRASLQHLGSFQGERTLNTDGVWIHQQAMPRFPLGAFYACHDDRSIAAFDLESVLEALDLEP